MPRAFSALVLGLILAQAAPALALDPEQIGKEAREDLKDLLEKQRRDRNSPEPKPDPPKTGRKSPSDLPNATASDLPAVCIGCGAK